MDTISIIMPCYNVEQWLDRSMCAITQQTIGLDMLEIICVDDCSTDGTVSKLMEWEARFPEQVMVIQSPENGRQGQARNIGLQYASGDWVAFLDSDDWVELDYLEKLYTIAKKGNYQVVCCKNGRDFSKELTFFADGSEDGKGIPRKTGKKDQEYVLKRDEDRKKLLMCPALEYAAWGKLIHREFLLENEIFFLPNLTYEDVFWGSLLHLYAQRAYVLEERLYHYFVNESSTILTTNSNHHLDCLSVNTMLWEEWEKRGFLDRFRPELEIEHIYSAYLAGMKALILRYEKPDYNIYLLLRTLILQRIPDYRENKYIQQGCMAELHMLMLEALNTPLNKPQFMEFAENIKRIGI